MKHANYRLWSYSLRLKEPLSLRRFTLSERRGLVVEVIGASGQSGWGEIAPLTGVSRESLEQATEESIFALRKLRAGDDISGLHLSASVAFGIDAARKMNSELERRTETANSDQRKTVAVNAMLHSDGSQLAEDAERCLNEKYKAVKLKVGSAAVEADIDRCHLVHRVIGSSASIRLDANRKWTLPEATAFCEGIKGIPIEYIEEPLADVTELEEFSGLEHAPPIALDETLSEWISESLFRSYGARFAILHPSLLGSAGAIEGLISRLNSDRINIVFSSLLESSLGLCAIASLAHSVVGEHVACGLDTQRYLKEDLLIPPVEVIDGLFRIPTAAEIAASINRTLMTEIEIS